MTTSPLDLQNPWCTLGTMRRYAVSLFCFLPLLINCHPSSPESPLEIGEASGVMRHGDDLIVVDDSTVGSFFRLSVRGTTSGPLISLRQTQGRWSRLSEACLALDLEGVDQLADGRLLFLSERMRSLIGEAGLIAEYESLLGEFANRGLEGVACRPLPGKVSRIAVVWEGGYPDYASVPLSVRNSVGRAPMRPLVVVHDLNPGARGVRLKMRDAILSVELEVPEPEGVEPEAQRFRAPDLAWSRLRKTTGWEWGFVVLITSQNSKDRPEYRYHWLQRFDLHGKPFGEPLDLARFVPPSIQGANWEGLGWFEPGKSIVLVHEASSKIPPHAFILALPEDWQYEAANKDPA